MTSNAATGPTHESDDDSDQPILLTGATGMIGKLLVDALLKSGVPFTVMARPSPAAQHLAERPGVRVVHGDFDDQQSLLNALDGARRAFLLTNSTESTERQQLAFVIAAQQAGVHHIVKLSQLHARHDSPVRFLRYHAVVEDAIDAAGITCTSVRPNLVLQAYLPFAASVAAGSLVAPIGAAAVSAVDARDIAEVAAASLTSAGHEGATYDVTGPAAITHSDIAAALQRATGHPVAFTQLEPGDFRAALLAAGMPAWQAEGLLEDYAHYDRGEAAEVSQDVLGVTGHQPRSLDDFARDYATAFSIGSR